MTRYYVRPETQNAYGRHYVGHISINTKPIDTQNPDECFYANFSGYSIPPGCETTIGQLEDYYIRGLPMTFPDGSQGYTPAPSDRERLLDDGQPISGDHTAVFRYWRTTGRWPLLREVWASIGLGPDGQPPKPEQPVQTSIFDLLEAP